MASVAVTAAAPWARPKYALFLLIALMLAYVLYHNLSFLIDPADERWTHYRVVGRYLLPHGILGAIALSLGATQFSTRLRSRWPAVHRLFGRVYMAAVLTAAPLGVYIEYLDEQMGSSRSFTVATAVFAFLWIYAVLMAFANIRARRIDEHRQWMIRGFATAVIFFEVRVLGGLTGWDQTPATDEIEVWALVALAYPIADTILQVERWLQSRRRTAAAPG